MISTSFNGHDGAMITILVAYFLFDIAAASANSTEPTNTSSSGAASTSSASHSKRKGISTGARIGVGVGLGVLALVALASVAWYLLRAVKSNDPAWPMEQDEEVPRPSQTEASRQQVQAGSPPKYLSLDPQKGKGAESDLLGQSQADESEKEVNKTGSRSKIHEIGS